MFLFSCFTQSEQKYKPSFQIRCPENGFKKKVNYSVQPDKFWIGSCGKASDPLLSFWINLKSFSLMVTCNFFFPLHLLTGKSVMPLSGARAHSYSSYIFYIISSGSSSVKSIFRPESSIGVVKSTPATHAAFGRMGRVSFGHVPSGERRSSLTRRSASLISLTRKRMRSFASPRLAGTSFLLE